MPFKEENILEDKAINVTIDDVNMTVSQLNSQIIIDAWIDFIWMKTLNFETFDYLNAFHFFHHFWDEIGFSDVTQSFVLFQVRCDEFKPGHKQNHHG